MPYRQTQLETGYYYHALSRGINKQVIFKDDHDYQHALELIKYYSYSDKKPRYSQFRRMSETLKNTTLLSLGVSEKQVDIIAYCLMPNHFHFLLRQKKDQGISKFMADFQNSLTKYSNTRRMKFGSILQTPFKAILIENDYYLTHLSRYIHLNPYSSVIVKTHQDLLSYRWSSLGEFCQPSHQRICQPKIILDQFKNRQDYQNFVLEQTDHQLEIKLLESLIIESE